MADISQLEKALINAHNAGDEKAAKTLANEIIRVRGSQEAAPVSHLEGLARSVAQGVTLGFGDEIGAGLQAGLQRVTGQVDDIGEAYEQNLAHARGRLKDYREDNLLASLGVKLLVGLSRR